MIKKLSSLKESSDYISVDSIKVIKKFLSFSGLKPLELFIREDLKSLLNCNLFESVTYLKEQDFRNIKGEKFHKGAIAFFEKPKFYNLSQLDGSTIILNGVTSPENVGSIVRTISGLGFKNLIIDNSTCSPYLRRAIRVSMGNICFLKVFRVKQLSDFLKERRFPVYGTANTKSATSLYEWEPPLNFGILIGSEGHGISKEIIPLCDGILRIPIREEVEHLNAANACAIAASWAHYSLLNR